MSLEVATMAFVFGDRSAASARQLRIAPTLRRIRHERRREGRANGSGLAMFQRELGGTDFIAPKLHLAWHGLALIHLV